MSDTFETFWTDYPKKVGKGDARKAYDKLVKIHGAQTILDGLHAWNKHRKPTDRQFLPHPGTWLRAERFLDEHETIGENAMGYHTIQGPPHVTVGGRIFRYLELRKIRCTILAGNPVYEDEWKAFKEWQTQGNDRDVRLPSEPAQPPTAEERAAYIEEMKERGLL